MTGDQVQVAGLNDIQTSLQGVVRAIYSLQQTLSTGFAELQSTIPLIYGSMYANNIALVISVAAADTFYEIDSDLSGGRENLCTFQNAKEIKITTAGDYMITYSVSAMVPVANKQCETAIMINGTEQVRGTSHSELSMAGVDRPGTMSGTAIYTLAADDLISLAISNKDDTTDITIQHVSLSLLLVS